MMNKKDYRLIAEAISECQSTLGLATKGVSIYLASALQKDNPNFNTGKQLDRGG